MNGNAAEARTTEILITVDLTPERKIALGAEQAHLRLETDRLRAEKKKASDHYQTQIDSALLREGEIAATVESGKEDIKLECAIDLDYAGAMVHYRHPVTGEAVKSRPMEEHERQDQLPIEGTTAAPGETAHP